MSVMASRLRSSSRIRRSCLVLHVLAGEDIGVEGLHGHRTKRLDVVLLHVWAIHGVDVELRVRACVI
jgi:hypothetical protein